MDESEFKKTYEQIRELGCPYEKALLSRQCSCAMGRRFNLAEREGVFCTSWTARNDCEALLSLLREKSRFALGLANITGPIPHAKEIRLQLGGLGGLQQLVHPKAGLARVEDIHALVDLARTRFGNFDKLPFAAIVQSVSAFQGRRRRSPRKPRS
ncbi:MAG: hypothetical protein QNJ87_11615 [Gammaproteobacteria bacterium]|nr:hypothetical protein [Gammaproteobacteria bacterium]